MEAKPYRAVVSMCFNVETADKVKAEKDIEHLLDRSLKAFAMHGYHSPVKLESIERPLAFVVHFNNLQSFRHRILLLFSRSH